jgi:hypothetical protein
VRAVRPEPPAAPLPARRAGGPLNSSRGVCTTATEPPLAVVPLTNASSDPRVPGDKKAPARGEPGRRKPGRPMRIRKSKALVDLGIDPKLGALPEPQTGIERHVRSLAPLATARQTLGALIGRSDRGVALPDERALAARPTPRSPPARLLDPRRCRTGSSSRGGAPVAESRNRPTALRRLIGLWHAYPLVRAGKRTDRGLRNQ